MSSAPLVSALVLAAAIPLALIRAYRRDPAALERWAREHDVELAPESRPIVARYLRRARLLRTWGGIAGAVLPSVVEYAATGRVQVLGFGTDGDSAPLTFGTIFVGYLGGALIAEMSRVRPAPGPRRAASLARRDLRHYLPRRDLLAQRGAAAAGAAGVLAIGVVPYPGSFSTPGLGSLVLGAAAILVVAALLEALERWLVRRPQPYTSATVVAADDAIRAQSIRSVARAGLALLLLCCCGVSLGLQASETDVLRRAMVVPAALFLVLSVLAARDIGEDRWRVRRRLGGPASTAPA